ncbi:MAG: MFS transporter [Rickettsia sp.]|nr:MFS transporter [Rickettsia sp.]
MKKILIAGMIGNALEWYDYAIYAQLFNVISLKFFPSDNSMKQIWVFAIFAIGSAARPIGGIVFGYIGDKFGRKIALMLGILTMSVPTAAIGILPPYSVIGMLAPVMLVLIRIMQGLALGGEFSGCIAYIVESSPSSRRGFYGSTSFMSMCLGMAFGSAVTYLLNRFLSQEDFFSWGWRLPFIGGFVIGLVGLYIRKYLSETPLYSNAKKKGYLSKSPLKDTIQNHWKKILLAIFIYLNVCVPFYTITIYMKSYMIDIGYSDSYASISNFIILLVLTCFFPISAYISDFFGRKPMLILASILLIISTIPLFFAFNTLIPQIAMAAQILLSISAALYMGPIPTTLVEIFPMKIRFTGIAISYNLSVAIFGSTIPVAGNLISSLTGNYIYISYYLVFAMVVCLITIGVFFRETSYINSV